MTEQRSNTIPPMPEWKQYRGDGSTGDYVEDITIWGKQVWAKVQELEQVAARIASERACLEIDNNDLRAKLEAHEVIEAAILQGITNLTAERDELKAKLDAADEKILAQHDALVFLQKVMDESRVKRTPQIYAERDTARAQSAALQSSLALAVEALEFYADARMPLYQGDSGQVARAALTTIKGER